MNAYSLDLRERVIQKLLEGELQAEVAEQFAISLSTVEKWWRQWRETASIAPQTSVPGPTRTLTAHATTLRALVKQQPDATLAELCDRMASKTGVQASPSMMCRELQILALPRKKKTLHDSQRDTPRVKRLRRQFKKKHARRAKTSLPLEIYR